MPGPITWRNVNGGNGLGVASRILDRAGDQFQGSLDSLGGMLNATETNREDNRVQGVTNNTNAFLDQLAGYQNPEDLQAAEAQLRQQLAGYGNTIDRDKTRGAINDTLVGLRTEANAQRTYDEGLAADAAKPIWQELQQAIISGNDAQIAALSTPENMSILNNAGLGDDFASLNDDWSQKFADRERAQFEQNRSDSEYTRNLNKVNDAELLDLRLKEAQKRFSDDLSDGIVDAGSEAILIADFTNELAGMGIYDQQYTDWARGTVEGRTTLTAGDEARRDTAINAAITAQYPNAAQNSFLNEAPDSYEPSAVLAEILPNVTDSGGDTVKLQPESAKLLTDALSGTFKMTEGGQTSDYRLTPSMVKKILSLDYKKWSSFEPAEIREAIEKEITSDSYKTAWNDYENGSGGKPSLKALKSSAAEAWKRNAGVGLTFGTPVTPPVVSNAPTEAIDVAARSIQPADNGGFRRPEVTAAPAPTAIPAPAPVQSSPVDAEIAELKTFIANTPKGGMNNVKRNRANARIGKLEQEALAVNPERQQAVVAAAESGEGLGKFSDAELEYMADELDQERRNLTAPGLRPNLTRERTESDASRLKEIRRVEAALRSAIDR